MASVLRDVAEKATIHQVPNISRAFVVRNGDNLSLKTEGINILVRRICLISKTPA